MKKTIKLSSSKWNKISQTEILEPEVLNTKENSREKFLNAYKALEESLTGLKDQRNMAFCVGSFAKLKGQLNSILSENSNWK